MGELSEMMLDGLLCQECGAYIGGTPDDPTGGHPDAGNGYPVTCDECIEWNARRTRKEA